MPKFLMTIDVEPDSPAWANITSFPVENVARLERLQALCDRYGVRPTYLTTYAVATDPAAGKIMERLAATGRCEIGTHFHPSETPPLLDRAEPETSIPHLPSAVKAEKLGNLHAALASRFGAPTAFRAGRYRLDGETLGMLEGLGYAADTSVTPHVSWVLEKGPRWAGAPERPYRPSRSDPARAGDSPVVEIPVTIREARLAALSRTRLATDLFSMPFRSLPRPLSRLFERVRPLRPEWLRPTYLDGAQMIALAERVLAEDPDAVLNMMFHSNELMPGMSPFVRTEREADAFFDRIEQVCNHLARLGVEAETLTSAARAVAAREGTP